MWHAAAQIVGSSSCCDVLFLSAAICGHCASFTLLLLCFSLYLQFIPLGRVTVYSLCPVILSLYTSLASACSCCVCCCCWLIQFLATYMHSPILTQKWRRGAAITLLAILANVNRIAPPGEP